MTKTKIGGEWGMIPGVPNKFQWNPVCSYPSQNFRNFFLSASVNFKTFYDKYFVVKSHSRAVKLPVEFNVISKTGLQSKIRIPWAEILALIVI
jgi:hypothetical protein